MANYAKKLSEPTDFFDLRRETAWRTVPAMLSAHLYAHTCASEKRNEREGIYERDLCRIYPLPISHFEALPLSLSRLGIA